MDVLLYLLMLIIPLIADIYVKANYNKYGKIQNKYKLTGYDVARKILDHNNLNNLYIVETKGTMTDHYDPTRKTVKLSSEVYHNDSVSSLAIAAHECGHAIQDKEGYFFLRLRTAIYPVVNIGTRFAYIVLIIGIIFESLDLVWVGILLVALGLIFQLITLPVEFDASKKALSELEKENLADNNGEEGAKKMLTSAALTYVAGVLSSSIELLRLIMMFSGNRRD